MQAVRVPVQPKLDGPDSGMAKTRVCVVGLRGIPGVMGGIESHCEQVFPRLKALSQQYDITIIGRKPYLPGGACEYQGVRVVPLPALRNKYLEAISNTTLAVFYARFALKAEILHIHGIGPALLGPLGRALGTRHSPELRFVQDELIESGARLSALINKAVKDDADRHVDDEDPS
ncbi:MAG: hypothetical protein HC861_10590 [Rhodospirillaceae bacterium]|nr:hypothetical protein [Rhodospirillaceae bacterium]